MKFFLMTRNVDLETELAIKYKGSDLLNMANLMEIESLRDAGSLGQNNREAQANVKEKLDRVIAC